MKWLAGSWKKIEKSKTITKRLWEMVKFTPEIRTRKMVGLVTTYLLFCLSGFLYFRAFHSFTVLLFQLVNIQIAKATPWIEDIFVPFANWKLGSHRLADSARESFFRIRNPEQFSGVNHTPIFAGFWERDTAIYSWKSSVAPSSFYFRT